MYVDQELFSTPVVSTFPKRVIKKPTKIKKSSHCLLAPGEVLGRTCLAIEATSLVATVSFVSLAT